MSLPPLITDSQGNTYRIGTVSISIDFQLAELQTQLDLLQNSGFITLNEVPVTSVAGKTGAVILNKSDVELSNVINIDTTNPANINQSSNYRFVSDIEKTNWNSKQDSLNFIPENTASKGAANGYAPLDSDSKIPIEFIPLNQSILFFNDYVDFPLVGQINSLYIDKSTFSMYLWNGSNYLQLFETSLISLNFSKPNNSQHFPLLF